MRDSRLQQANTITHADKRREAAQLLALVADRAGLNRLLEDWWAEVLAQDSPGEAWATQQVENLRTKCASLPAESRNLGLMASNTLARSATGEAYGVGALLLGESAATVIRRSTSVSPLDRAVKFLSKCWEAIEAMREALLRDPVWPADAESLGPAATNLSELRCRHFPRDPTNEALLNEDKQARERGLLAYFWGRHFDRVEWDLPTRVRLMLLSARDWQSLALHADALPLRALRGGLWRSLNLHEDRDSILFLIQGAPPVFLDNGWTGSTSALAALAAVVTHANQLHHQLTRNFLPQTNADEKLKELEEQELPIWMKQVAQATLVRSDGRLLLLFFGASLIREALHPSMGGQHQWSSAQHALCAIYEALVPKPSVAEIQQVANLGVPTNQTSIDHVTYLFTAASFDASANDVWKWYRELLEQNNNGLCQQANAWRRAFCYGILAERLGELTDPFKEWRTVWNTLFVTDRERARFDTLDRNALYPSLHLLRVGAELLRQQPKREGARQFFEELLSRTRYLLANDSRLVSPFSPEFAVDAIDVAPLVLGSDWRQALDTYRPLLSSVKNRVYIAKLLLEGGASFTDVEVAVEGAPHRLMASINELKKSDSDINIHQLCDIVAAASAS